jgi:hypothetical protein
MLGWTKWLIYILSFCIPPAGVITFWVFYGRSEEQSIMAKWCLVAAFAGIVVYIILGIFGITAHRMLWDGMGRWR